MKYFTFSTKVFPNGQGYVKCINMMVHFRHKRNHTLFIKMCCYLAFEQCLTKPIFCPSLTITCAKKQLHTDTGTEMSEYKGFFLQIIQSIYLLLSDSAMLSPKYAQPHLGWGLLLW